MFWILLSLCGLSYSALWAALFCSVGCSVGCYVQSFGVEMEQDMDIDASGTTLQVDLMGCPYWKSDVLQGQPTKGK